MKFIGKAIKNLAGFALLVFFALAFFDVYGETMCKVLGWIFITYIFVCAGYMFVTGWKNDKYTNKPVLRVWCNFDSKY